VKDPWVEDASWMERAFTWLLHWGGLIFFGLILVYMGLLAYYTFR
jgi:hypothetical protein